jgi:hypothetical protein
MCEEEFQARAEIVMPRIAVTGEDEPVLRTAPIAKRPNLATLALWSERIALVVPELALFRRRDELQQMLFMDVAQPVTRLDEMIARVNIAIVLQSWTIAASRGVNAQQMPAEIRFERHVEELNINTAYVMPHPLLEDIYEEAAVLFTPDRAFRD